MKILRKKILLAASVILVAATAVGVSYTLKVGAIGTAYVSKILCSAVFISHREPQSVFDVDLSAEELFYPRFIATKIDRVRHEVSATFLGLAERRAIYTEGRGCTIVYDENKFTARAPVQSGSRSQADEFDTAGTPRNIDRARVEALMQWAFAEPDPALPRRTRAVVVLHKGRLIAEGYAPGFTKDTPLVGWSMTKSVTSALVGVLVKQGKLSINDPAPVMQWQSADDPRRKITMEQLLHMSSGLEFEENYAKPLADPGVMLFGRPDAAAYAADKPLVAEPGKRWSYSSGTTNIVARVIRTIVGESDYPDFPRRVFFDRLGMQSALIEMDASGTFVGSSSMYATARDWARFGLFYLQDGVWHGERILPEGWVTFSREPAPADPERHYGAHFWRRAGSAYRCGGSEVPADTYYAAGHEGQFLTIIPSRELVIVRLGLTRKRCAWDQHEFINRVLSIL